MFIDDPYAYNTPPRRFLTYIPEKNIELVNWDGVDISVHQIFYGCDIAARKTSGILVMPESFKDLEKKKRKNRYCGNLYIRARTKIGLWEITMKDVRVKEMAPQVNWFEFGGVITHHILKKPSSNDDE